MKTILKLIFILAICTMTTPALAQLHVGVGINIGPPAPVKEEIVIAKPYRNAVWIPGYHQWRPRYNRYFWVKGHWGRPPHAHMVWFPGRWEQRNHEWVFYQGRWDNDRSERR
jgi:hypothetical protein